MTTKIICMAALFLGLHATGKTQDLVCGGIGINGTILNRTARIKIVNQGEKDAKPLRVYVELHTNNERDNPIAQLSFTEPLLAKGAVKQINLNFSSFMFVRGFSMLHVKKIVVICDPKKEVKETNEENNTKKQQIN